MGSNLSGMLVVSVDADKSEGKVKNQTLQNMIYQEMDKISNCYQVFLLYTSGIPPLLNCATVTPLAIDAAVVLNAPLVHPVNVVLLPIAV